MKKLKDTRFYSVHGIFLVFFVCYAMKNHMKKSHNLC